jgi:hypothetical protein
MSFRASPAPLRSRPALSLLLPFVPALLLVAGCGDGLNLVQTHPVSGSVTVDGQPGVGVQLHFHPVQTSGDRHYAPFAESGPDGTFKTSCWAEGDGAPPGEYIVTAAWQTYVGAPYHRYTGPDKLRGRYESKEQSTIKVTIKEGDNVLAPIVLTTK